MKLEKIINGYMMIALLLLFIMGRLLDYAWISGGPYSHPLPSII